MKSKYEAKDISDRIVARLTLYLGILKEMSKTKTEVNSGELSHKMNTTAVQVRKDLSTFGEFGVRGKGYNIVKLIEMIEAILGIDKTNDLILVGYGKMGTMIASNIDVLGKGFKLVGIFEKDLKKIGVKVEESNLIVRDIEECSTFIKENNIHSAILAVNSEYGQVVAENIVNSGIKAILNMTASKLELSNDISVVNSDISAKLQELNFWRLHKKKY